MIEVYGRYVLYADASDNTQSLTLLDASNMGTSGTLLIESEEVTYSSISSNTINVDARGIGLTNASSHSKWTEVWHKLDSTTVESPQTAFMVRAKNTPTDIGFQPQYVEWRLNGNLLATSESTIYVDGYYDTIGPRHPSIAGGYVYEIKYIRGAQEYTETITVTVGDWDVVYAIDGGVDNKADISALTPNDPTVAKANEIVTITPDIDSGVTQDWTQYVHIIAHSTGTDIDSIEIDWDDTTSNSFPLDGTVAESTNLPAYPARSVNCRLSHDYTSDASYTITVDSAETGPSTIESDTLDITVARTSDYNVTEVLVERRVESENAEAYIPPSKSIRSWTVMGTGGKLTDIVDSRGYEYRVMYRTNIIDGLVSDERSVESNFSDWEAHP